MRFAKLCAGAMVLCAMTPVYAAPPKGFEEFRKGLFDDFNSFKSRILEHYSDFLDGTWHEYESLEAMSKFTEPKPSEMPVADFLETEEADDQRKQLMLDFGFRKADLQEMAPKIDPAYLSWMRRAGNLYNAAPAEEEASAEPGPEGDIVTRRGFATATDDEVFNFYGMKFALPKVSFAIADSVVSTSDYARQWDSLVESNVADTLIEGIKGVQEVTGLSDYLIFKMIMAYADGKFPHANDASKMSLTHYLLTHMGFGVRLAMDNNLLPYMLIPFEEQVFGRSALRLEQPYYVFSTPGREATKRMGLMTPDLPSDGETGKAMKLRMNGVKLPYNPYYYSFAYGDLRLEGEMNQNVIPMLYRYPQMNTGGFADSCILPEMRQDVVRQVKEQLGDMDPLQAADKLLAMIQFGFTYSTDEDFHGFEKPYFFEESLFYPKCDCEDRAVFYSYLLWNALGLEADLIAYPWHEATAIKAEKVWGGNEHYTKETDKYFISDPTYQGAPTGQCMRRFSGVEPVIDLSYKRD